MNLLSPSLDNNVFSVSQIALHIKKTIETSYHKVQVRGEISGLKVHSSGHQYLCLKDEDAVLDAVIWRGTKLSFPITDGIEVIATGKITTYPGRSKYQLVIQQLCVAGQGALLKLFLERKKKFEDLGYFSKKRPLPSYPRCIGVITSETGAVICDILHRLEERYPVLVKMWNVSVQGQGASGQIAKAINGFNAMPIENRPDVLIIARGGGSIEDLWAFNEEEVVIATFHSEIPIISAVGHETDTTLIDYASDKRAPTPTAAAEIATPCKNDLTLLLGSYQQHLGQMIKAYTTSVQLDFFRLQQQLPSFEYFIFSYQQRLDDYGSQMYHWIVCQVHTATNYYERLSLPNAKFFLTTITQNINMLQQQLLNGYKNYLHKTKEKIKLMDTALYHCSFERSLEKGFCLITHEKDIITCVKQIKQIKKPCTIELILHDGQVKAHID